MNPVAEHEGRIYQRAYKACVPCREKKVKCYLGPADQPAQPPCIKCRRSGLACYFDDKTRGGHRKRRKTEVDGSNGPSSKVPNFDPAPDNFLLERNSTMLNENDPLAVSELRNSGDAFNMLAAAAATKTSPIRNPSVAMISPVSTLSEPIRRDASTTWGKCIFVQNQYLTHSEAIDLVFFYYTALRDSSPFAHMEYADSNKHEKLIEQDTLLLAAILTVASRLHTVPGIDGWSRSQLIHDRMWKWTKKEISSVVFGGRRPDKVGIGIVEACLLLSEWAPKDVLEGDEDRDIDQSVTSHGDDGNRDIKVVLEGAYRTDRFSWIMTGTAHTLLQHFLTQPTKDEARLQRDKFSCYAMISSLSRRLGQSSNLSMEPIECQRHAHPQALSDFWTQELFLETLEIIHSAHLIFYPDKETTRKLVEQGTHLVLFRWFQSITKSLRSKMDQSKDSFGTIQIELNYEYQLLYVYSLSLHAMTLSRTHGASSVLPRPPVDAAGPPTPDHAFVLLAFEAAKSVIRLTMDELTRFVSLSHISARYLCKIVFSASFLIKVMYVGGIDPAVYPETIAFLDKVVESLQVAALDDLHPALRYGYLIQFLLQKIKSKVIASRRASPVISSDEQSGAFPGNLNFELPDGTEGFGAEANLFDFGDPGSWEELFMATGLEEFPGVP